MLQCATVSDVIIFTTVLLIFLSVILGTGCSMRRMSLSTALLTPYPLHCMHPFPLSSRHPPPLPQQLLPPPQRRRLTHHDVLLHCSSVGSAILELLRRPRAPPPRLKRLRMRGAAGGGRAAAAHRCGGTLVGAAHSKRTNYLTARTQGRARLR